MKNKEEQTAPKLRFKGYTDAWQQRKLGEVLENISYGLNTPADKFDGENKYLRITDIDDYTHKFRKNDLTSPKTKNDSYLLKEGDIVFARTGASVGKTYKYDPKDKKVYYAGFLIKGSVNHNNDATFIFYTTLLNKYIQFVKITSMRSGQPGINAIEYQKFIFNSPKKYEQNKIGDLLSKVDHHLSLLQRKLGIYSSLKNVLLKTLYPYPINAESNPIIHFKGYNTKKWKTKKLGEIFSERSKKNPKGTLLSVSMNKGIYPFNDRERKNNSTQDKSNYKQVEVNDIAYNSMRMWQGALGVSNYQGIVSPAYTVIYTKNRDNPKYYFYYFKKDDTLFKFQRNSQGITSDTWNLKFPLFKNISISVSESTEEKNNIAFTFEVVDTNIKKINEKISHLNKVKKFLLQNMFI